MKTWKGIVIGSTVALSIGITAPTFASHEHYIDTPGTCVADVASGQTSKEEGDPGGHQFHLKVHKGQPGLEAFTNPNNPITLDRGSCPVE